MGQVLLPRGGKGVEPHPRDQYLDKIVKVESRIKIKAVLMFVIDISIAIMI